MILARTPLAAVGVVLTTACALLFLIALGAESYGLIENPYVGILIFFALPAGFLLGLLLVLVGNLRGRKRGAETITWPTIDLKNRGQRIFIMGLLAATLVNVVILSMAGAVSYTHLTLPTNREV